jgi:hypothetical protein
MENFPQLTLRPFVFRKVAEVVSFCDHVADKTRVHVTHTMCTERCFQMSPRKFYMRKCVTNVLYMKSTTCAN